MDMLMHLAIGILSVMITLVANAAAHLMPRQPAAPQQTTTAQATPSTGVEYGSLPSSSLNKELKFAVQFPPSYQSDTKRRYPVPYSSME
jgi:hypothetical protein